MIEIKQEPKARKTAKDKAPAPSIDQSAPANLSKPNPNDKDHFNMILTVEQKQEIKMFAMMHNTTMTKVMLDAFDFYKANNS